jgi:4-amino-4-deoxy-L-arabinose transferase-like glycosyltransferase
MLMMQLVPAASRPFVDGSTDNNVFAMVFGYNGIDRLFPNAIDGAVRSGGGTQTASGAAAAVTKLIDPLYLGQIGWLYPAALFGVGLGVWSLVRTWRGRSRPRPVSPATAMFVVLVVWLVTGAAILSAARMPTRHICLRSGCSWRCSRPSRSMRRFGSAVHRAGPDGSSCRC